MTRIRSTNSIHSHSEFRVEVAALDELGAVLNEIRVAEEQVARGQGIEHDDAKRQVLARLGRPVRRS